MARAWAFFFDASACSGCKACAAACQDRHDTDGGPVWRRVYEISGGHWRQQGQAWVPDVVTYNLSISCNHCQKPICVQGCPSAALVKRPDGIVTLNTSRCLGCRYCQWSCPYGAPQYNAAAGSMEKCDFCATAVDQGLSPACVAACPMRALGFGDLQELIATYGRGASSHPLPHAALTRPALVLWPHPQAARAAAVGATVANQEEVGRVP